MGGAWLRRFGVNCSVLGLSLGALATIGVLVALRVMAASSQAEFDHMLAQERRFIGIERDVLETNQRLAYAAAMAALTGDQDWVARFDALSKTREAALSRVLTFEDQHQHFTAAQTAVDAGRALDRHEQEAIAFVRQGQRDAAAPLLFSSDHARTKARFINQMERWTDDVRRNLAAHAEEGERRRDLVALLNTVLTSIVIVFWILAFGAFLWVRRRQKHLEAERQTLTARLTGLLQYTDSAIYLKDADGRYVVASRRLSELYNRPINQIVGYRAEDIFDPETARKMRELDEALLEDLVPRKSESTLEFPNGQRFTFLISKFTIEDPGSGQRMICGVCTDMTEQKRLRDQLVAQMDELRVARRMAEKASRMKSAFMANMSHELRTPLNGIMGMTQLLLSSDLNDDQSGFAETTLECATSLLTLINDLLELTRIEAGEVDLDLAIVSPAEVLTLALGPLQAKAAAKPLKLTQEIGPDTDHCVWADESRLVQIIRHLAGNAIKFTPEGEVRVSARLTGTGPQRTFTLTVSDTGPGVPRNARAAIFDRFHQMDGSSRRQHGGSGLGLALCKELVCLMGGEIGVRDSDDGGAEFWFSIPCRCAETTPRLPSADEGAVTDAADTPVARLILEKAAS